MNQTYKFLSVFVLAALLALAFNTPAYAFDGRGGDRVVIASDEVINDDLYVGAQEFLLDGTVNGDVVAFGQTVTIHGKVNGDLMTAAQTVAIYGEVTGTIRMAGTVLFVANTAKIGGDILGAGYSLEVQPGKAIGRDLIFAGQQLLLASDVTRNVQVAGGAFELRGKVGGDVYAEVGDASQPNAAFPPTMFMPQSTIPIPGVKPGITVAPSASIAGNLKYTQSRDLAIPAGVVLGTVVRTLPAATQTPVREETSAQRVEKWALGFLRNSITLILIGLFLLWLFPVFMRGLSETLQAKPLPSLGWGVIAWAAFFFVLLVLIAVMIIAGIVFGFLTLSQLTGTVVWLGILLLFGLIVAFVLVTTFVAKVVFGVALGKWILARLHSPLAEHRYWPMVLGVLVTLAVTALLSFPLIPGFLGWLVNFAVVLLGLGTLWLWGRERMARRPAVQSLSPIPA
ncbi:MAG TPA: polymer-forming cytoskeletal protein [Anaerolineales bacterium]|nr:polymer-forming cytoskeletal protein [Anaerolineales bacterium]